MQLFSVYKKKQRDLLIIVAMQMKKETKKKQQNDLWVLGVRKYQSKANEKRRRR